MAHPASKRKGKRASDKKSRLDRSLRKGVVGTNAIDAVQKWANSLRPYELKYPANIETFHEMYTRDESVGGVLNATYALVENAFSKYQIKAKTNSKESKLIADFLTYQFENMKGSVREFSRNAATFNQFGFSVIEKDYKRLDHADYHQPLPSSVDPSDMWTISRLMFIPQRSLNNSEPFIIGNQGRDILACRQDQSWFTNSSHALRTWTPETDTVELKRNKFLLMGMNVTDSNPMGLSPLEQIWVSWKEKKFFEALLSTGASKDMAGMPLLEIPQDILDKASIDPTSPEAMLVDQIAKDVASMHAGEQNMMILPSDMQEGSSTQKDYNLKFLGIDGSSSKQFDLQSIIDARRQAIYASFGASNLISNETGGSYNQLEGQNNIHMFFVKRIIRIIEEAVNKDLIPQILTLNGISLKQSDIPEFKAGEIEPISLEEMSKMIQRIKSVNGLVLSKQIIVDYHERLGFDTTHLDKMSEDELHELMDAVDKGDSKSGTSMGTSGQGDSQNSSGGDNNMDNTA